MTIRSGTQPLLRAFLTAAAIAVAGAAHAHPHVLVTAKSDFMLDGSGKITGVRHAWTFDEAYSAYAVTGLKAGKDGKVPRENLVDLAKLNVESLQDFSYFTALKQGKKAFPFNNPADGYYLEHDGKALILHFVLPLKEPVAAERTTTLEVQDESFFVAFSFAEKDPIGIEGPTNSCRVEMKHPKKLLPSGDVGRISEDFFNSIRPGSLDQFFSSARLICP